MFTAIAVAVASIVTTTPYEPPSLNPAMRAMDAYVAGEVSLDDLRRRIHALLTGVPDCWIVTTDIPNLDYNDNCTHRPIGRVYDVECVNADCAGLTEPFLTIIEQWDFNSIVCPDGLWTPIGEGDQNIWCSCVKTLAINPEAWLGDYSFAVDMWAECCNLQGEEAQVECQDQWMAYIATLEATHMMEFKSCLCEVTP